MAKQEKYKVVGDTLTLYSSSAKPTHYMVYMDEVDARCSDAPEVTKFRVSALNDTVHYTCDIEELRNFIEVSEDLEMVEKKGKEGYLVPLYNSVFSKTVSKSQDSDKWIRQREAIIQASGGPWSIEKRQEWAAKFAAPVKNIVH